MRRGTSTLLAALASLALGCGGGGPAPARNVVLIVVDTLRADHLGVYGYARDVSPHLDTFAAGATRYTRAIASSPWTLPSHASLFTGLPPWAHGAHLVPVRPTQQHNARALDEQHLTLAEALRAEGFRTAGFAANTAFLSPRLGLDQGFETWEVARESARTMLPKIRAWLEAHGDAPFFLFVNFMDTHRPYNAAPRPGLLDRPAPRGSLLGSLIQAVLPGLEPPPQRLVRDVIDQYDTAIAHVDAAIGLLLDDLRALGLFHPSLVVVTSDHGEFFGEHALVEHAKDVYQEVLAVPLIVKSAGQRQGRTADVLVSSAHVPHLVVRELSAPVAERLGARFPRAPDGSFVLAETHFGHAKDVRSRVWGRRFRRARRAVFDWPYKLIHSSDGRHELYHLKEDPEESENLVSSQPGRVARYGEHLASRPAAQTLADDHEAPSARARERLRALGYVK